MKACPGFGKRLHCTSRIADDLASCGSCRRLKLEEHRNDAQEGAQAMSGNSDEREATRG